LLTKIRLEGFKAVASAEIELRPLTVLIGRNGAGKSSLIEALQWLQESLLMGLDTATGERFGAFDDLLNRRKSKIGLNLEFDPPAGMHVRYKLWVRRVEGVSRRPIVDHEECVVGRTTAGVWPIRSRKGHRGPAIRTLLNNIMVTDRDLLALSQLGSGRRTGARALLHYLRDSVFLRLSPAVLARRGRLAASLEGPVLDQDGARLVSLLAGMTVGQRAEVGRRVAEVIAGVTAVRVAREGESGHVVLRERMRARGGTAVFDIPAWLMSEGTRRLTAIFAVLACRPRPPMIVVEEIENGLDPWTLKGVFAALRDAAEDGVQVIVTTHSPFLLDHVDVDEVVHVRREKGDTTFVPIQDYESVMKYAGVVAPGAMYVSDYLKAPP
jgi:predicted ATPase